MEQNNPNEKFRFDFLGFKIESDNPGKKTILILVIVLLFMFASLFIFKEYVFSVLAGIGGSRKLLQLIISRFSIVKPTNNANS